MSKTHDALREIRQIVNPTQRALELAGLISTLFKLHGVALIVTGELAYSSYADTPKEPVRLELASYTGRLTPRLLQEIMGGDLQAQGSVSRWNLLGIPVEFRFESSLALRDLCRDFVAKHGIVKLRPAEEITAECVLAAVFPSSNPQARGEALTLMTQALVDAFEMDWIALRKICEQPEYAVSEELVQIRVQAKQSADASGLARDQIGGVWSEVADPRTTVALSSV